MKANLEYLAKMTESQKEELNKNGSVVINGTTVHLSENGFIFTYDDTTPSNDSVVIVGTDGKREYKSVTDFRQVATLNLSGGIENITLEQVQSIYNNIIQGIETDINCNGIVYKYCGYYVSLNNIYNFSYISVNSVGNALSLVIVYDTENLIFETKETILGEKHYIHNVEIQMTNENGTASLSAYLQVRNNKNTTLTQADLYNLFNRGAEAVIPCSGVLWDTNFGLFVPYRVSLINIDGTNYEGAVTVIKDDTTSTYVTQRFTINDYIITED